MKNRIRGYNFGANSGARYRTLGFEELESRCPRVDFDEPGIKVRVIMLVVAVVMLAGIAIMG